jgi:hypothetical protein
MTRHLTEEELVLYRYREAPERPGVGGGASAGGGEADMPDAATIARHLGECEPCRREFEALDRVLAMVDVTVPEPSPSYERDVWARIQDRLEPEPRGWRALLTSLGLGASSTAGSRGSRGAWWPQAALAATVAVLLVVAFTWRHVPGLSLPGTLPGTHTTPAANGSSAAAGASGAAGATDDASGTRNRVLLAAVDEHLQRSEFVLTELNNLDAQRPADLSSEQAMAEDLVSDNRLYRRTALDVGDRQTASLLDELERALLDVAHAPSSATPAQLEELRDRLDAQGVLFKVRVAGAGLRERQMAAVLVPGPAGL